MANGEDTIRAFGIELRPLTESDLPLLLYWRRQPEIARYMETDRLPQMAEMLFWFRRMKKSPFMKTYVVLWEDEPVGFTELKNIRPDMKTCEDGIFMYGFSHMRKGLGRRVMLCREIVMVRASIDTLRNRICNGNQASLQFYRRYGPKFEGGDEKFTYFVYEKAARMEGLRDDAHILGLKSEFFMRFYGSEINK